MKRYPMPAWLMDAARRADNTPSEHEMLSAKAVAQLMLARLPVETVADVEARRRALLDPSRDPPVDTDAVLAQAIHRRATRQDVDHIERGAN